MRVINVRNGISRRELDKEVKTSAGKLQRLRHELVRRVVYFIGDVDYDDRVSFFLQTRCK